MELPKFDNIVPLLQDAIPNGNGFLAHCPLCGDNNLTVNCAGNGIAQLFCLAGCRYNDIVAIFTERMTTACSDGGDTEVIAHDEEGALPVAPVPQSPSSEPEIEISTSDGKLAECSDASDEAGQVPLPEIPRGEIVELEQQLAPIGPEPCLHGQDLSAEAVESARALVAGIVKGDRDSIAAVLELPADAFHTEAQREVVRALHLLVERGLDVPEPADYWGVMEYNRCSPLEFSELAQVGVSCQPKVRAETVLIDYQERIWREGARQLSLILPSLSKDEALDAFEQTIVRCNASRCSWNDPIPLPDSLLPVEPFEPDLLPDSIRPWIVDVAERMQCPIDYPAIGAMVVFASIVGRQVGIRPKCLDTWSVVANLWGLAIGLPGSLKTPAIRSVMAPLTELEALAEQEYKFKCDEFEKFERIEQERKRVESKLVQEAIKSGENNAEILKRIKATTLESPIRKRFVVNDSTVEKLGEILSGNPNGVLMYRDELMGWLVSLDKEGQEGARAFFLEAWDGSGSFICDRISRGTTVIPACCLSVLGTIQPGPLREYFLKTRRASGGENDGLIQRFQLMTWPDAPRSGTVIDRRPDQISKERASEIARNLSSIRWEAIGAHCDGGLPYLHFSDEAQKLYISWLTELEAPLRTSDEHPAFISHLAKYRSLVPSLALIIHLVDSGVGPVSIIALKRACEWAKYLESHARRVYAAGCSSDIDSARSLLVHIKRGELARTFTARDIYRRGWSRLSTPNDVDVVVRILVDHGYLRERRVETGGRPSAEFTVHPSLRRVDHGRVS